MHGFNYSYLMALIELNIVQYLCGGSVNFNTCVVGLDISRLVWWVRYFKTCVCMVALDISIIVWRV